MTRRQMGAGDGRVAQVRAFQRSRTNLSYNVHMVWKADGVPLHPGAARLPLARLHGEGG